MSAELLDVERPLDVVGALRTHPLSDERGGVVAADGDTVLADGDDCWFSAQVDLAEAPRRVGVDRVDVFADEPADPAGDVVGTATLRAAPSTGPNGQTARLVLANVETIA